MTGSSMYSPLAVRFTNISYNVTEDWDHHHLPEWIFHFFMPSLFSVVCATGIIGNSLVIFVFLKYMPSNIVPNVYILNLASTDLIIMLELPFLTYFNTTRRWVFGDVMCRIVMGIDGLNVFTGIFTLAVMSVDRYLAIVHAVWSKNHRSVTQARLICLFMWCASIAITLPLWMYAQTQTFGVDTMCNVLCPEEVERIFSIYSFVLGFCTPLMIILLCYLRILIFLANCRRKNSHGNRHSKLGKVGILVLLAVVLFIVCWFPFWLGQIMVFAGRNTFAVRIVYYVGHSLTYANCCLNPLVYIYVRQDFRQHLKKIIFFQKCLIRRENNSAASASKEITETAQTRNTKV
ncbi:somatostatin receptor type 4-like [Saccoglossus kowalevskii]|uniref:Somatostatin receptor type 4-like n=1 Tax=Saccoglossus kowalevskii TaxID=10224 RepID=A0ABM0GLV1_SACKO|nr:PREDICTED: somatostatin receptor type 4-like [Saccoglossus kowalevskii]